MTNAENGTTIFWHWADNLERNDSDKSRWDRTWIAMFKAMADNPGLIWSICTSFGDLKTRFEAILPGAEAEKITKMSASSLGIFLDVLCEAVFDAEKHKNQNNAQNEGAENA